MKRFPLLILLFATLWTHAAHLVGGEISYKCLGNYNYEFTLKVYRDCNSNGAAFDQNANISIFDAQTMVRVYVHNPTHGQIVQLPATVDNPCLQTPPNVCTELAVYTFIENLPPAPGGYIITYQRCCRNQTITNIPNPGTWGSTYTVNIPPNDVACNSSPAFLSDPPIVLCSYDSLNINSSASELDGDSLYYEFCDPLHGGSQNTPAPIPASPPPYSTVPFLGIYTPTNPLVGLPPIQIDPNTGIITGRPTQTGQYVIAICVSEYRNGQLLSTVRRDYQFNVTNCQSNVKANINLNQLYCTGKTIFFTENSVNGQHFFWDFGDVNTSTDTSSQRTPSYTFADTGTYQVMLIVNKGWACADTTFKNISVHYPAEAAFTFTGPFCLESGAVNFSVTSNNHGSDDFLWNFGTNATPSQSNDRNPIPVQFSSPGKHVVSLKVNSFGCEKTVYDTVEIYLKPELDFNLDKTIGCAPLTVSFLDASQASTAINYEWNFGDGNLSNQANPIHTYQTPGSYDVKLRIYTHEGCIDTVEVNRPSLITVNPTPVSSVLVSPIVTNIYNSVVEVTDLGTQGDESFYVDMGDGTTYRNNTNFYYQYKDTGTYRLQHVVSNDFECHDTTTVLVRINPVPLIFAPTAFTPNGDGKNDIYLPAIIGSYEYELIIYSRWGDIVFHTKNPREGWNGHHNNDGEELPIGVYTFTIHVRDINMEVASEKGMITLIR